MAVGINAYNAYTAETATSGSTSAKKNTAAETKQYNSVEEYAAALSKKFSYFNRTASVYGVPTTITVSSAYLQKCVNDPEEAKVLEGNLAAVPEATRLGESRLKAAPGSPVTTYRHVTIDENGHISSVSGCTNDPDGKIARENALKSAKKRKENAEKLEKKRTEKKEQKEKLAEKRAENKAKREAMQSGKIKVSGTDMLDLTEKMIAAASRSAASAAETSGTIALDVTV